MAAPVTTSQVLTVLDGLRALEISESNGRFQRAVAQAIHDEGYTSVDDMKVGDLRRLIRRVNHEFNNGEIAYRALIARIDGGASA